MRIVSTPQGDVTLREPTLELLRAIRSYLPFGIARYSSPQHGADFGIVMQCGEREVYAVKQQPVDCDEEQSFVSYEAHSLLIAHSIAGYLRGGFSGLFMPCAYLRKKPADKVEAGISYFGFPSAQGRESQEFPLEKAFDRQFGHGFTTMMTEFIRALQQSSRETGIGLFQPIGLDVRPRLLLGSVGFSFMVIGPHVVCLKTRVEPEADPAWTVLRGTGISDVYHMPSVPMAISEEQLSLTKPPTADPV